MFRQALFLTSLIAISASAGFAKQGPIVSGGFGYHLQHASCTGKFKGQNVSFLISTQMTPGNTLGEFFDVKNELIFESPMKCSKLGPYAWRCERKDSMEPETFIVDVEGSAGRIYWVTTDQVFHSGSLSCVQHPNPTN